MTRAKICGLSTPDPVAAALAGGAAWLGFVFFPASPRAVDAVQARQLAEPARGRAEIVAVTVDADDRLLTEIALVLRPDWVQLHGAETPARAAEVRRLTGAKVIRALPVSTAEDVAAAAAWSGAADALMFDARPPADAALPGGVGARFDWGLLQGRAPEGLWFLAGGLDPGNVAEAVRRTGAPAVDVSSGVESAPGVKDPALIRAFLDAV